MSQDIRFEKEGNHFKFRVAGIVESKDKVLVVKMNNNDFYCFPGGHVELMESTTDAVKRELEEELYFKVSMCGLLYIGENFFYHKIRKENYHELCFYYLAKPADENFEAVDKIVRENDKNGEVVHQFKWIKKEELGKIAFKPKTIAQRYVKGGNEFLHFISRNQ